MNPNLTLTKKEEAFCQLYSVLGHPHEAAIAAGYPAGEAPRRSADLLTKEGVLARYQLLREGQENDAMIGLKRLAFSPINDIVRLISSEYTPTREDLASMDLFAISEIRLDGSGRLAVSLYDRFQALETLLEHQQDKRREPSIYDAIAESAAAWSNHKESDELEH